jgi:2,4-dienoyl-CoA reductase-like NADH-dependent reductase (Old Yellow Enzyme family)
MDLKNRLAVAPMSRVSAAPDGTPTDEMSDYYRDFAHGGFGVVITEGTYIDTAHSQGYLNQPGLATDAHVDGWRRVTDAVHAAGAPVIAQLMHAGALSQGNSHGVGAIAPSAITPRSEARRVRRVGRLAHAAREAGRRHRLRGSGLPRRRGPRARCGV